MATFTVQLRCVIRFGCGCCYDLSGLQLVEPEAHQFDVQHDEPGPCPRCGPADPDDGEPVGVAAE